MSNNNKNSSTEAERMRNALWSTDHAKHVAVNKLVKQGQRKELSPDSLVIQSGGF